MAQPPSIKATALPAGSRRPESADRGGEASAREEVEARLRGEDLRYLDKQLAATTWIPIDSYRRRGRDPDRARGGRLQSRGVPARPRRAWRSAFTRRGLYRQFEASSETWGNRVGKIAATMAAVLYNFTKWSFELGSGRGIFTITVDEADRVPGRRALHRAGLHRVHLASRVGRQRARATSEARTPPPFEGQAECVPAESPGGRSRQRG